jgi:hypothetical protein
MKNRINQLTEKGIGSTRSRSRGNLKIGYIFSRFRTLADSKQAKMRSLFTRNLRPYGL